jgi:regulator of CtrA degradation
VGSVATGMGVTISFAERFASSQQFDQVFQEGMALVEATANYLEGQGRRDSKAIGPASSMLYASESMRLTTRLLELASWLVIRRALKAGEIGPEEARVKRRRLRLTAIGRPQHVQGFAQLPDKLKDLIEASFALHDRITHLDRALEHPEAVVDEIVPNPVAEQVNRLSAAFAPARAARR